MKPTTKYVHHSRHFYGNEISEYGLENGYIDYRTLAKCFDAVMCNDIITRTYEIGYWECVNGSDYDEETDETAEVFQFFIISAQGAEILEECTNEIVWYNEELDLYVWGVTHWGTSWDYVLTDIPVKLEEVNENE